MKVHDINATETVDSEDINSLTCAHQLDSRPLCKYGVNCYRRNPSHFQQFRHPGNV